MIEVIDGVAYVREKPEILNDPCPGCAFNQQLSHEKPCTTCVNIPFIDTLIYRRATLRDHVHDTTA